MQELIEMNLLVGGSDRQQGVVADGYALCAHAEHFFVAGDSCCPAGCQYFLVAQFEF